MRELGLFYFKNSVRWTSKINNWTINLMIQKFSQLFMWFIVTDAFSGGFMWKWYSNHNGYLNKVKW